LLRDPRRLRVKGLEPLDSRLLSTSLLVSG
jgi:hypothetical protein